MYQLCIVDWGPLEDSTFAHLVFDELLWPNAIYPTLNEAIKAVEDELNYNLEEGDEKEHLTVNDFEYQARPSAMSPPGYYEGKFDNYDDGLYVRIWEMTDVNPATA
jgi:hypothetical protein